MLRRRAWLLACGALFALTACIHVEAYPIAGAPAVEPRAQECLVEAFRTKSPARAYVEVARVEASGGAPDDLEDALRQKACALGADAVIITGDGVSVFEGHSTPIMKGVEVKFAPAPTPQ